MDVVILPSPLSAGDSRVDYKNAVLIKALELTQAEYGPFQVNRDGPSMNRKRALQAIQEGQLINLYFAPDDRLWREKTIPILIPIRRGILNYRLLLIHSDNREMFSKINSLEALKTLKLGTQYDWSLRSFLEQYKFTMVPGGNYDGLFVMLENKRFDYMLRGVHEIFNEIDTRKASMSHLTVEPHLAVYVPTPTYTYVSPRFPRLAQRIQKGLEIMVTNGDLKQLFEHHFREELEQADLKNRKILFLEESHRQEMLNSPNIWYNPYEEDPKNLPSREH